MKANFWRSWLATLGLVAVLWVFFCPSLRADGNDGNTIALLHMDGTDGSTTFTDSGSGFSSTWTAVDNAQIDTAQSVFGGASGLFDGTGDRITAPDDATWDFGTGNYCVDFRVRFTTTSCYFVDIQAGDAGGGQGPTMRLLGADRLIMYTQNNVKIDFTGTAFSTGVWYHIALNRSGTGAGQLQLFRDGTEVASGTDAANLTGGTAGVTVADSNAAGDALDGWLDEVRISNTSRFTANFTPQDHAYHTAGGGAAPADVKKTVNVFNRESKQKGFLDWLVP